jgi:hypothetical protein
MMHVFGAERFGEALALQVLLAGSMDREISTARVRDRLASLLARVIQADVAA